MKPIVTQILKVHLVLYPNSTTLVMGYMAEPGTYLSFLESNGRTAMPYKVYSDVSRVLNIGIQQYPSMSDGLKTKSVVLRCMDNMHTFSHFWMLSPTYSRRRREPNFVQIFSSKKSCNADTHSCISGMMSMHQTVSTGLPSLERQVKQQAGSQRLKLGQIRS